MPSITWTDKVTGASGATGTMSAADANEIKSVVNAKADQSALETGLAGRQPLYAVEIVAGGTRTLAAADNGKQLHFTASAPAVTVPLNAAVALPGAYVVNLSSASAGTITFAVGATVNGGIVEVSPLVVTLPPVADRAAMVLVRHPTTPDVWFLFGEGGSGAGVTPEQLALIEGAVQPDELMTLIAAESVNVAGDVRAVISRTPNILPDAATYGAVYAPRNVALASNVLSFDARDGLVVYATAGSATVTIAEACWTHLPDGFEARINIRQGATGREIVFANTSGNLSLPDDWPPTFVATNKIARFAIGWDVDASLARTKRNVIFIGFSAV